MLFRIPVSQIDTNTVRYLDRMAAPFVLEVQRSAWALVFPLLNRDGTINRPLAMGMGMPESVIDWLEEIAEGENANAG